MTAGRGITHSERTGAGLRQTGSNLFGIQAWVALSARDEECAPAFEHYEASALPTLTGEGKTVRLIAGEAFGARSPVRTSSPMVYADVALEAGATLPLDPTYDERAIYTVSGAIDIAGDSFGPGQLLVISGPATGSACGRSRPPASWCSAASRWMGRATSGGTSSPRGPSGSSRPRRIGARRASTPCRASPSSSPCRNPRRPCAIP